MNNKCTGQGPNVVLVSPHTFLVAKGGKGGLTSAFARLQGKDSVIIEMVVPEEDCPRVLVAHVNDLTLEHPSTLAFLRAAKLSKQPNAPTAVCRVYGVDKDRSRIVMDSLKRETGLGKVLYLAERKPLGTCIALDLATGVHRSWRACAKDAVLCELAPPKSFWDRVKSFGYSLRNGPFRHFRNRLYIDQFPEQGEKRTLCKYCL